MIPRLKRIAIEFLAKRRRHLPVVVKLSHNLSENSLEELLTILIKLKYDGVNIGNSSPLYSEIRAHIDPLDYPMFDYFTTTFGGGVSGRVLKERTLSLCTRAVEIVQTLKPAHEFHVIRTGGIENYQDLEASVQAGISFNHWYTSFFMNYNQYGSKVYQQLFSI
jgi:dihydroorotate dehydrogenase